MTDRNEFINKVKAQLDEWNGEIAALESKLADETGDTKQRLKEALARARDARDAAVRKINELESAGEHTWETVKGDVEHVWEALRSSVAHFKSQI